MKPIGETDAGADDWDVFETRPSEMIGQDDIARAYERCFTGNDGAVVLQHLRETTIDRRLGPDATNNEIWFLEGERTLAARILSMVNRGSR